MKILLAGAARRFLALAVNPWMVLSCVLLGAAIGWAAPGLARPMAVVGAVYVDLLTMMVLPFMMSAVVLSLQSLYREGGAGRIMQRVVFVFALLSLGAALVATLATLLMQPGGGMSETSRAALGQLVDGSVDRGNTAMFLFKPDPPVPEKSVQEILRTLVPSNIFAALANGETLKALVFALLFGFAVGQVPSRISGGLQEALETVHKACQILTRWINLPLPLVLVCMSAGQVAHTGVGPLVAMAGFVAGMLAVGAAVIGLALLVVRHRAGGSMSKVAGALREPFALGVATNNSAACMPAMVAAMTERLGFARARVELLVPLSVALLRTGPVAYFVCGALFIAALYGRALGPADLGLLVVLAAMAGFASSGMAGVVTVSLMGSVCAGLALPFEAAFVLFAAVDPICAMVRTAVTVMVDCAAVSLVCARPVAF